MSDLVGLSTEVKPKIADKPDLVEGTKYFEMDTLKTYKYSATDDDWYLYSGGSSGGANPEIINSDEKHLADLDAIAVGWKEEVEVRDTWVEANNITEFDTQMTINNNVELDGTIEIGMDVTVAPDVEYNGVLYTEVPICIVGENDVYGFGNPYIYNDFYEDNNLPFFIHYGYLNDGINYWTILYVPKSVEYVDSIKVFKDPYTEIEYHKIQAEYLETANPEIINSDKHLGDLSEIAVGWYEPEDIEHTELSGTLVRRQYDDILLTSYIDCNFHIDLPDYPNTTPAPSIEFDGVTYDNLLTYAAGEGIAGFGNPHIFNPSFEYTNVPMFIYFDYSDYDETTRTVSKVRIMSIGDYIDEGPITVKLTAVNSPEQYHGIDAKYIGCENIISSKVIEFTDEYAAKNRFKNSQWVEIPGYTFKEGDFEDNSCFAKYIRPNGEVRECYCELQYFSDDSYEAYRINGCPQQLV